MQSDRQPHADQAVARHDSDGASLRAPRSQRIAYLSGHGVAGFASDVRASRRARRRRPCELRARSPSESRRRSVRDLVQSDRQPHADQAVARHDSDGASLRAPRSQRIAYLSGHGVAGFASDVRASRRARRRRPCELRARSPSESRRRSVRDLVQSDRQPHADQAVARHDSDGASLRAPRSQRIAYLSGHGVAGFASDVRASRRARRRRPCEASSTVAERIPAT